MKVATDCPSEVEPTIDSTIHDDSTSLFNTLLFGF